MKNGLQTNHSEHWMTLEQAIKCNKVSEINIHRRLRQHRSYEITFRLKSRPGLINVITRRKGEPRRWGDPQTLIRKLLFIAPGNQLPRIFISFDPC